MSGERDFHEFEDVLSRAWKTSRGGYKYSGTQRCLWASNSYSDEIHFVGEAFGECEMACCMAITSLVFVEGMPTAWDMISAQTPNRIWCVMLLGIRVGFCLAFATLHVVYKRVGEGHV